LGADVNLAAADGATPLLIASRNGHTEIVKLLLESGADVNLAVADGATPLIIASRNGYTIQKSSSYFWSQEPMLMQEYKMARKFTPH
jgi:ankyrin repeat protein